MALDREAELDLMEGLSRLDIVGPSTKYTSFITSLQSRFGIRKSERILPQDKKLFDILLKTQKHKMRFRFHTDNFDLVGYQLEGTPKWLEFTGHPQLQQLITGSTSLGFAGGYHELACTGKTSLEKVQLGRDDLVNAVDRLAATTLHEEVDGGALLKEDRARSLLVVNIMLGGAIRYCDIEAFLVAYYDISSTLGSELLEDTLNCRSSSITVRQPRPHSCCSHGEGLQLVEVFWVRINHSEENISLYGTINVGRSIIFRPSKLWIYDRQINDPETVGQGKNCTLTGPASRCIEAMSPITFDFDLHSSTGCKVACGQVHWCDSSSMSNIYGTLRSETVRGRDGFSATLYYKVFKTAVQATVVIELKEDSMGVFGVIEASSGNCLDDELLLFQRGEGDPLEVQVILFRSIMAVPLDTFLRVQAILHEPAAYNLTERLRHSEIANGYADFDAKCSGFEEKCILGEDGEIKVLVTWSDYCYHV